MAEPRTQDGFAVVIPFFNERDFLPATLRSIYAQDRPPALVLLIDNASNDGGAALAADCSAAAPHVRTEILHEPRPGKIHALEAAMERLRAPDAPGLVAFCDADTYYPPHYLALAAALFQAGGAAVAAVMAVGVHGAPEASRAYRRKTVFMGRLLARQCHTGGYGQMFRRTALEAAGGFSSDIWPYVLLDHEIMQRVLRHGRAVYHDDLWCRPSDRRADRSDVRWTLAERLLYHATPFGLKDWFFYQFLGPRFARRGLYSTRLRRKSWEGEG